MKFFGCYLTIATALAKMKIVTWVILYARDGSNTSSGWGHEVLALRFSHGIGVGLVIPFTSPPCFGTESKLGVLHGAGVFNCSLQTHDGGSGIVPCQAVLGGSWHGWEANCVQVRSRQSQGFLCLWNSSRQLGRVVLGMLEVRSSWLEGGTQLLGAAREKKVSPPRIKGRELPGIWGGRIWEQRRWQQRPGRENGWKVSRQ